MQINQILDKKRRFVINDTQQQKMAWHLTSTVRNATNANSQKKKAIVRSKWIFWNKKYT